MRYLYIVVLIALSFSVKGQDVSFTQSNRANIYFNPASVGNIKSWMVSHQYRNQWSELRNDKEVNRIGVQYGFNKFFKGVGFNVLNESSINGALNYIQYAVPFSFGFQIKKVFELSVGFEAALTKKTADWSKLGKDDIIPNLLGSDHDTMFFSGSGRISNSNIDFSGGMEVRLFKFKYGFAAAHLLEPGQSLFGGGIELPMRITNYLNYDFSIGNFGVTPSLLFNRQNGTKTALVSATTTYRFVKLLMGYRVGEAPIIGLGVKFDAFDIGYTYDLSNPQLSSSSGGSHEVGVRFRFGKNEEGDFDKAF